MDIEDAARADARINSRIDARIMTQSIRGWNDVLSIWRLCRNAACIRACACRGEPRGCLRRHFPLLPEGVRAWFVAIGEAQREGLSFDQAMDRLDATEAGETFHEWSAAVRDSVATPRHCTFANRI